MRDLAPAHNTIAPMSATAIETVRRIERCAIALPQVPLRTSHVFHAGLYARTITIPAGAMITGALIKIATVLIVNGDVVMYAEGGSRELHGYHVLAASAQRKQAFLARAESQLTMLFATSAETVDAAEEEFTDEGDLLVSRRE